MENINDLIDLKQRITYMNRPDLFVEVVIFGLEAKKFGGTLEMTDQQRAILLGVAQNRKTGVKSGRGIGKSAVLSWLIIWWLAIFDEAQVAAFAPSFGQLNSVLWPEIAKWLKRSMVSKYFVHTATKMYLKSDPKNTFAEPRTASKEEAAQGLHADNLLILMDEAPGIDDGIWQVLQGSLSDANNKVVMMGNPARTSGFFFDAFHSQKKQWKKFSFSSENSPNVDKAWLAEMKDKYIHAGIVHDVYKVHIQGEFPSGDTTAFIPLEMVTNASFRQVEIFPEDDIEIGVDVARFGDDLTCISIRHGFYFFDPITLAKSSIDLTVSTVLKAVMDIRMDTGYDRTIKVKVDDTGVGGGVTDYLNLDRENDIEVIPCNFGGAGNGKYANEASKMWGLFKDNLDRMHLPDNRFLKEELSSRGWDLDAKGRIKINPKSVFKKNYGSSPDHADAFILALSDKLNERRQIKSFDYVRDGRDYSAFELSSGKRYASMFLQSNGLVSAVFTTYTGAALRVVDEYTGDTSDIIKMIEHYSPMEKIIGSSNMFNLKGDDMFMKFVDRGIFLQESYNYDMHGSTRQLEHLASINRFLVASECVDTSTQLRQWTINDRSKSTMDENGLCMALLHVVSELYLENSIVHGFDEMNFSQTNVDSDANAGFMAI